MRFGNWYKKIMGRKWGYSHDLVGRFECPYLERRILWLGWFTLRYHKFLRSDEDRSLHDHPWWFVTFPLDAYDEMVPLPCGKIGFADSERHTVKRWRFHYRPASYMHRVMLRKTPTRTIVVTGARTRRWGFHKGGIFYPYAEYFREFGTPPCADPKPDQFRTLYRNETKSDRCLRTYVTDPYQDAVERTIENL